MLGDGDFLRAALGAVGAARTGHGNLIVDNLRRLKYHGGFLISQGLEVLHKAEIVLHLLEAAHAGKNHLHLQQAGCETDGPTSWGQAAEQTQ